jgi:hypothetical protein
MSEKRKRLREFKLGPYTFIRQANGKWGCRDGHVGYANYRTPFGAYVALRRFQKGK